MVTEVFNRIGEAEMHESSNSFGRFNRDDDSPEPVHKIESGSKKFADAEQKSKLFYSDSPSPKSKGLVDAKKEFFKSLEDDSLTIDTCEKVNHDWKKA